MHSFIIISDSQEKIDQQIQKMLSEWKISKFDIAEITSETSTIGIDQVRKYTRSLMLKPQNSNFRVGIIRRADTLTHQAQQSLLKFLEEPPKSVKIILSAPSSESLLPTIISRCQKIFLKTDRSYIYKEEKYNQEIYQRLYSGKPSLIISAIDQITQDKNQTESFINQTLMAIREEIKLNPSEKKADTLINTAKKLLEAKKNMAVNISSKNLLDRVFLIP